MAPANQFVEASLRIDLIDLRVLAVSDGVQALLGFSAQDLVERKISLKSRIHPDDQDIAAELFSSAITPRSASFNVRLRHADGRIRCLKGFYEKSLDENGGTVILDLLLQDARSLQQSPGDQTMMANFRAMMDSTDDFIFFKDRNHVFTGASQTLVAITDPVEHWTDLLGKTDYDVFPEPYADVYYQLEKLVFAGIPVAHEVQEIQRKDGTKGWVDNRKYPIHDEAGKIIGLFGIARDITDRKRMSDALAESEQRFRSIFEQVPSISVQGYNRDRQVIFWNPASERLYGYTSEQAMGRRLEDLIVPKSLREPMIRQISAVIDGGPAIPAAEIVLKGADGHPVETFSSHVLLRNINDEPEMYRIDIDISEQKRIAAELQQEQLFSRSILDGLPGIFYLYTYPECRLVLWNHQHEKLLGYTAEEMAGRHVTDFHVPQFKADVMRAVGEVMKAGHSAVEAPLVAKDGHLVYFALTGVRFDARNQSYFLGIGSDITERKRLEDEQQKALGLLQKIASRVPGVVYQFRLRPDGSSCFPFASEALREIYRLAPEDVREDASKMYAALHPDDLEDVKMSVQKSAQDLTPWQHDYRVRFDDGTMRWLSGNAMPEREPDGGVLWHGFITDISERKALEEQVRQMAFLDALTNLPNRRLLNDRLSQAMASSTRSGCYGAVIFLDLDHFKPLNDRFGHGVGDQLLVEAGHRLKRCVRGVDTVARFGGDEFVVMIGELEMSRSESTAKARLVAEKIRMALSEPYSLPVLLDGKLETTIEHRCSASIGLNLFIGTDASQDEVLLGADKAMYQAKDAGRNSLRIAPEPPKRCASSKTGQPDFVQLAWHTDYESGNDLIDNQHRALFDDANRLISAILSERQTDEISALIDHLVRDVVQHFNDEESIFTAAGFHDAAQHCATHQQLIDRAIFLVDRFHAGTLAVGELFQFLAYDVVSRHMLKADREYFPYLKRGSTP